MCIIKTELIIQINSNEAIVKSVFLTLLQFWVCRLIGEWGHPCRERVRCDIPIYSFSFSDEATVTLDLN